MSDASSPPVVGPALPVPRALVSFLAVLFCLGSIAWAGDFYRSVLGLILYTEQYLAGMLAVALALIYLSQPAIRKRPRTKVPWYDALAALLGFAAGAYVAVRYPVLSELVSERPADGLIAGTLLIALVLEGLRRTVGLVLVIVVLVFFAYGLVGHLAPGELAGRPVDWDRMFYYLSWDPSSMLGTPMIVATTIIVAFVFFGQLLSKSGGSAFFTDISMVLMGRYRGGSAKIAVTASGLFGSISGSAVSNVVSTGVITIPLMRQGGYPSHLAGAIEAVASTGGQLMPPVMGAAAFLIAEFLRVPYKEVALASLVPAILYYVALFIQADLEAARGGISRIEESRIPDGRKVMVSGWFFPLPFAVLIGALFWLNRSPEESALYGAVLLAGCGLALGYQGKRMKLRDVVDSMRATGMACLDIVMITAAAGFVIGVLNLSGLGFGLTLILVQWGGGSLALLLIFSAIVCIVLGMGMPTVGVYVLLATLVAPALVEVGVDPMAAHLFVMYFGMMSMITPPVAIAAFAAASLAQTDAMRTGFAAMRFGWLAYVIPFLFIKSPSLLLKGNPLDVFVAIVTAVAGVWLISASVVGYFKRPLAPVMRMSFATAGLLLLMPSGTGGGALTTDIVGFALAALLVSREAFAVRKLRGGIAPS